MAQSRKPTMNILQLRRIQLIFTSFIFFFSLLILLISITSNPYAPITEPTTTTTTTTKVPPTLLPTATSHLLSASNYISSLSSIPNTSSIISAATKIDTVRVQNESDFLVVPPTLSKVQNRSDFFVSEKKSINILGRKEGKFGKKMIVSCDVFDGKWVLDHSNPVYSPGSCPFLDYTFDCFNNGRFDLEYLRYRWQPHGCDIPRFDGKKMLSLLRGKRMVFVGDSLNRNMWQSLICSLRSSLVDKKSMIEVSGARQFRTEGFYSFRFLDYNCTIEFIRSPFLVQQWKIPNAKSRTRRELLRLDLLQATTSKYHNADFLIFNTGHWWTHHKTRNGKNFFQEGDYVHSQLKVPEAYTRAIKTWANWVDKNVNKKKTHVFFVGYSASHFRGGLWNSGGSCDGETEPITNDKYLAPYPWMMKILESVMSEMSTPVVFLNITKMTGYRKDAHPSLYRKPGTERQPGMIQDCSHWCLPGVPESWNQLLYASLLMSSKKAIRTH